MHRPGILFSSQSKFDPGRCPKLGQPGCPSAEQVLTLAGSFEVVVAQVHFGVNSLDHVDLPLFDGRVAKRTVPDWGEVSAFQGPHHGRHLWMATLALFAEEEEKGWLMPDRRDRREPDKTYISKSPIINPSWRRTQGAILGVTARSLHWARALVGISLLNLSSTDVHQDGALKVFADMVREAPAAFWSRRDYDRTTTDLWTSLGSEAGFPKARGGTKTSEEVGGCCRIVPVEWHGSPERPSEVHRAPIRMRSRARRHKFLALRAVQRT